MCNWVKSGNQRIDPCLRKTIQFLQNSFAFHTLACCCGHGKYKPTVVYKNTKGEIFAAVIPEHLPAYLLQGTIKMPRKKRFYRRDADGVFFIPEFEQFITQQTKAKP
jgi:hypothetical protein